MLQSEIDPPAPVGFISHRDIALLVECFYARVRADARLGPVFETRLAGRWPEHLEKMKGFWRTVLLGERAFKGDPAGAHRALTDVVPQDYDRWLFLFRETATECLPLDGATQAIFAAERIAANLRAFSFGLARPTRAE